MKFNLILEEGQPCVCGEVPKCTIYSMVETPEGSWHVHTKLGCWTVTRIAQVKKGA